MANFLLGAILFVLLAVFAPVVLFGLIGIGIFVLAGVVLMLIGWFLVDVFGGSKKTREERHALLRKSQRASKMLESMMENTSCFVEEQSRSFLDSSSSEKAVKANVSFESVMVDQGDAVRWAAEHGYDSSQVMMGMAYENGQGLVLPDLMKAYAWFALAERARQCVGKSRQGAGSGVVIRECGCGGSLI